VPADKVFVVPHPYSAEEDRLAQDSLGLTKVFSPTFYSIGAWQPRKGMHELLGAFLMAFKPGEATLRLRVTEYQWKNYPSPRESVKHWLDDAIVKKNGWTITSLQGKVDIFTRNFTPQELHMFHARNRIYVSASHGEAWNLPAFDAKRYGNLVVHVSWGGTKDFCDANDVAIPFKMDPVDPSYGWGECQWAGYQMHDLIAALRTAARNPHGCVINARFSEATVGHTMLFLLQRLSAAVNTPESQRELFQGVS
jgi:glycosyltransferase involved in cell wall biosynthesis